MTQRRDPLEEALEAALEPGRFIGSRASCEFVCGLEETLRAIRSLIKREPERALVLIETFIAACTEKMEEVDDSGGGFGMFVQELFCAWIRARQSANVDAEETVRLLLDSWRNDDYGCIHDIEKPVVEVLDRKGLAAFESVALEGLARDHPKDSPERRWLLSVLRTIYLKQRNAEKYLEIAEQTGLTPSDCEALARVSGLRKKFEAALEWVDRGLELESQKNWGRGASWGLLEKRRELLSKLGRSEEAFEDAWASFKKSPAVHSFESLLKYVPQGQKSRWRASAAEVAGKSELRSAIELLVHLKEWNRLAGRVSESAVPALKELSHYLTEPAAKALDRRHPQAAAMLYQAMAFRILDAGKSKYYDAALRSLDAARRCLLSAGLENEWDDLVRFVQVEHRKKRRFMPGFEALLQGRLSARAPSLVERARNRRRQQFGKG